MIQELELQRFSLYARKETLFELIREDYWQKVPIQLGPIQALQQCFGLISLA